MRQDFFGSVCSFEGETDCLACLNSGDVDQAGVPRHVSPVEGAGGGVGRCDGARSGLLVPRQEAEVCGGAGGKVAWPGFR